jgi:hypothetical protein
MRNTKRLFSCVCVTLVLFGVSYGKDWHGIIPLRSTRADVERMLGLSSYGGGYAYETPNERVFFTYSSGECNEFRTWNAPRDTVVMIISYPKTKPLLSDLRLDLKRYKRTSDCNPGSFHYTEEREGISYAVDGDVVSEIIYYPNGEDKRRMSQCRPNLPKLSMLDAQHGLSFLRQDRMPGR